MGRCREVALEAQPGVEDPDVVDEVVEVPEPPGDLARRGEDPRGGAEVEGVDLVHEPGGPSMGLDVGDQAGRDRHLAEVVVAAEVVREDRDVTGMAHRVGRWHGRENQVGAVQVEGGEHLDQLGVADELGHLGAEPADVEAIGLVAQFVDAWEQPVDLVPLRGEAVGELVHQELEAAADPPVGFGDGDAQAHGRRLAGHPGRKPITA